MSDDEHEESDHKGDPDSTRLLGKVLDRVDGLLFKHGFEFKDDALWEEFAADVEKLFFKYYDDLTGGDQDYNPAEKSSGSEVSEAEEADEPKEEEEEESATLTSSSEEDGDEQPDGGNNPRPLKRKL